MRHFIFQLDLAHLGVTYNELCKSQSVTCYMGDKLMCKTMAFKTWFHREVCGVFQFVWQKCVHCTKIHYKLVEVYDDGVIRGQNVKRCCQEVWSDRTSVMVIYLDGPAHQGLLWMQVEWRKWFFKTVESLSYHNLFFTAVTKLRRLLILQLWGSGDGCLWMVENART